MTTARDERCLFAMRVMLVAAFLAFVGARPAEASCGGAYSLLSPPSGARLPPHPTIYLFDADEVASIYDALVISSDDDDRIKFRATKLATNPNYTVHRIELPFVSLRDQWLRIELNGKLLATYVIADDGVVDQARVVDVRHREHHWTCSFTDVIEIAVEGNAIAYQVEWEDARTTVVVAEPSDAEIIELGHPNCLAYNVEPELLRTPRSFELYALFADGKVKRLGSSIAQLDEDHVRLPVELIKGADARLPRSFDVAVTTAPYWVFASGAMGGLVGALVVFVVGRRRRRLVEAERLAPARWLDRPRGR